jgi:hypothetical protein
LPVGSEEIASTIAPFVPHCVDHYLDGPLYVERNVPFGSRPFSDNVLCNEYTHLSSGLSRTEQAALLHGTAAGV